MPSSCLYQYMFVEGLPWWLNSKDLLAAQETRVQSLGWEDPLEEGMATHSSILAWRIPWTEEPGGLQFMESQRDITKATEYTCMPVCWDDIKTSPDSRGLQVSLILPPSLESRISWPQSFNSSSLPADLILKGNCLVQRNWVSLNMYSPFQTRGTTFIKWSTSLVGDCSFVMMLNSPWSLHSLQVALSEKAEKHP